MRAGCWVRIGRLAHDGLRAHCRKSAARKIVVGVGEIGAALLFANAPVIVESGASFFLLFLTLKHGSICLLLFAPTFAPPFAH